MSFHTQQQQQHCGDIEIESSDIDCPNLYANLSCSSKTNKARNYSCCCEVLDVIAQSQFNATSNNKQQLAEIFTFNQQSSPIESAKRATSESTFVTFI